MSAAERDRRLQHRLRRGAEANQHCEGYPASSVMMGLTSARRVQNRTSAGESMIWTMSVGDGR